MIQMSIGEKLRLFRSQYRYPQGRFAGLVGVSQPYISALENGTVKPNKELVARINKAMKIIRESERAASEARNRVLAGEADGQSSDADNHFENPTTAVADRS
jgi:predicted transcriptional regulator